MIGLYRWVARKGQEVEAYGMLEEVRHIKSGVEYYMVVVGSGLGDEYIRPLPETQG
jgi:predicted nucleotidyltransferase